MWPLFCRRFVSFLAVISVVMAGTNADEHTIDADKMAVDRLFCADAGQLFTNFIATRRHHVAAGS